MQLKSRQKEALYDLERELAQIYNEHSSTSAQERFETAISNIHDVTDWYLDSEDDDEEQIDA